MAAGYKGGAIVQHEAARQALVIISAKANAGKQLSYQDLAVALGRKPTDARAMAQVCDLLDSAATLYQRPKHLTLVAIGVPLASAF